MWIILILICVGVITIVSLPYVLITRTELPKPSGKWQVGTQDMTWDKIDQSQTDIIAKVWYPTNDQYGKNSNYIDRLGRVFADTATINLFYKLIFWLLRRVTNSPALIDATPVDSPGGLPIILFMLVYVLTQF